LSRKKRPRFSTGRPLPLRTKATSSSTAIVPTEAARKRRCFVISPIGDDGTEIRRHANQVLRKIIRPALFEAGYQAHRIDQNKDTGSITARIIEHLHENLMCVAVLTGLNPNVMYEVGVRNAWDLPLVPLAVTGTGLPFDLKDYSTIFYSLDNEKVITRAVRELTRRVEKLGAILESRTSREVPQMLAPFGTAMRKLGTRYSLEPIFQAKENTLQSLVTQLRRIRLEIEKDFESGNTASRPLKEHAAALISEFDECAAKVEVFQGMVTHTGPRVAPRSHCDGILYRMKDLQRHGWRMCKKWKEAQGISRDFEQAVADINRLIEACQALISELGRPSL
jgi:hypothetical protein